MSAKMSAMTKGANLAITAALAGLYLRGRPGPPLARSRWPQVHRALARLTPSIRDVAEALRSSGFWEEAVVLDDHSLLDWIIDLVHEGRVLTAHDEAYPARWRQVLGGGAPPALWVAGEWGRWGGLSVVGSRVLDDDASRFAEACGAVAVAQGLALVSGGAMGADSCAAAGALACGDAARVVELLPRGILGARDRVSSVAVAEPWADFSTAQAMERNALIYAFSPVAVVAHVRLREGGTWHGAVDALRRRLCIVAVREDGSPGARALAALGAVAFREPEQLVGLLQQAPPPAQPELFGLPRIRERQTAWV